MTRDKLRLLKNRDSNRRTCPITTSGSIGAIRFEFTLAMSQCKFSALPRACLVTKCSNL